jgi:L-aspartate oxidase
MSDTLTSDFLIIGSGIAGLSLALKASEIGTVRLVTKRALSDSATDYAQGGLAAVFAEGDSFDAHVQDTLDAGGGLCDEAVVRRVVAEAPARIDDLVRWGVRFSADAPRATAGQRFELGLEGGHSRRRILHVGDYTGHAVEQALVERARENPRITIARTPFRGGSHHPPPSRPIGPRRLRRGLRLGRGTGAVRTFLARATALATGGAGKVYLYTSNPDIATGDGMAMAHRAGALLANLEFVQFHPTCLFHPKAKNFLVTEALRGEGRRLSKTARGSGS